MTTATAMTAIPPMMPPTIAPTGVEELLELTAAPAVATDDEDEEAAEDKEDV